MFKMSKEEKVVLIFFAFVSLIGLGVDYYKKKIAPCPHFLSQDSKSARDIQDYTLNINRAGFKELVKLKGVGPVAAIRIVDYRKENGPFFFKEDIMKVKGIGRSKFNKIRDYITTE